MGATAFRTNRLEAVLEAVVGSTTLNTVVEHHIAIERLHSSMAALPAVIRRLIVKPAPRAGSNRVPAIAPVPEQEAIVPEVEAHHRVQAIVPAAEQAAGSVVEVHHRAPAIVPAEEQEAEVGVDQVLHRVLHREEAAEAAALVEDPAV